MTRLAAHAQVSNILADQAGIPVPIESRRTAMASSQRPAECLSDVPGNRGQMSQLWSE
jgi:hypothetical protein